MRVTLKAARVNAGLTQGQVEDTTGIARSTLSSWEMNKTAPRIDRLEKLCELYGITLADLDIRRIKKMPTRKKR